MPIKNNPNIQVCYTCGFKWRTGQDGSHHCSIYLKQDIKRLKLLLRECLIVLNKRATLRDDIKEALSDTTD